MGTALNKFDLIGCVFIGRELRQVGQRGAQRFPISAQSGVKLVDWAVRQGWTTRFLDIRADKLDNENKLLTFLGYLGWLGSTAATIKQALFAVKDGHKRGGAGDPTGGMFRVWMLVDSLDRHADRKPRRLGVTPGMLVWIGKHLCSSDLMGEDKVDKAMVQAALLAAWFFMLKEFCDWGFDHQMVLWGLDVRLTRGGQHVAQDADEVTAQFRKTKSDQEAFGSCKTMGHGGTFPMPSACFGRTSARSSPSFCTRPGSSPPPVSVRKWHGLEEDRSASGSPKGCKG